MGQDRHDEEQHTQLVRAPARGSMEPPGERGDDSLYHQPAEGDQAQEDRFRPEVQQDVVGIDLQLGVAVAVGVDGARKARQAGAENRTVRKHSHGHAP